jgi:uncharacterized DUF497 family protein
VEWDFYSENLKKANEKLSSVELTSFDRILVATKAATTTRQRTALVAKLGFIIMVIVGVQRQMKVLLWHLAMSDCRGLPVQSAGGVTQKKRVENMYSYL